MNTATHEPGKRRVREIHIATSHKAFVALAKAALDGVVVADLTELGFEKIRAEARHLKSESGVYRFTNTDHRVSSYEFGSELIAADNFEKQGENHENI